MAVCEQMNMPVQRNKAIVGENAFSHSSGIHQDGVIKNKINYEIIAPEEVGDTQGSQIILTARSGRAALAFKAKELGFCIKKEMLNEIYQKFLRLADRNNFVRESDFLHFLSQHQTTLV